MKIRCAWCGKEMGDKDGEGIEGVSHGICNSCFDKMKKREKAQPVAKNNKSASNKRKGF